MPEAKFVMNLVFSAWILNLEWTIPTLANASPLQRPKLVAIPL